MRENEIAVNGLFCSKFLRDQYLVGGLWLKCRVSVRFGIRVGVSDRVMVRVS